MFKNSANAFLACLHSSHAFLSEIFGIFGKFRIDIEKKFFEKKFFRNEKFSRKKYFSSRKFSRTFFSKKSIWKFFSSKSLNLIDIFHFDQICPPQAPKNGIFPFANEISNAFLMISTTFLETFGKFSSKMVYVTGFSRIEIYFLVYHIYEKKTLQYVIFSWPPSAARKILLFWTSQIVILQGKTPKYGVQNRKIFWPPPAARKKNAILDP